ncbi:hypothetical protein [Aquimarina hainanensis]|uniref:hypothetical protein n=1 Tax=Aquimarina hainanensis TaxID=1578017 RepID=UPI0036133476
MLFLIFYNHNGILSQVDYNRDPITLSVSIRYSPFLYTRRASPLEIACYAVILST